MPLVPTLVSRDFNSKSYGVDLLYVSCIIKKRINNIHKVYKDIPDPCSAYIWYIICSLLYISFYIFVYFMYIISSFLRMYTCTWSLRATVKTTQAPQQIPKPMRRSSFLPEASTMNTWGSHSYFKGLGVPQCYLKAAIQSKYSCADLLRHLMQVNSVHSTGDTYHSYGHKNITSPSSILDVIFLDICWANTIQSYHTIPYS